MHENSKQHSLILVLPPRSFTSSSQTVFADYCFFWATRFLFILIFRCCAMW